MHPEESEDTGVKKVGSRHHVREVVTKWNLTVKDPNAMLEVKGLIERYDERSSPESEGAEIKKRKCGCGEQKVIAFSNIVGGPRGWLGFHFAPCFYSQRKV